MRHIVINALDNVAVALVDLRCGESEPLPLLGDIPRGHKIALRDIAAGEDVIKYGMPIGSATRAIRAGEWVHTHNLRTGLDSLLSYQYDGPPTADQVVMPAARFMGYRRESGVVGIRNHIFIIPTVGCVNKLAERLAAMGNRELVQGSIDRFLALTHPYGCSQMGRDHEMTRAVLAALARHGNAGGVLVVGLGCENNTLASFKELLGPVDERRVRFLLAQDEGDEVTAGFAELVRLAAVASTDQRQELPSSELVVGLKCGGSDGLSGITANALVGRFSDRLLAQGGSTLLSEVPEMFGAETLLMQRCRNRGIFDKCVDMINDFKRYFSRYGQVIYENPSPGNKDGGISTLEDKSLGCTQKGGCGLVSDVLAIGEPLQAKGLNLLTGPGNDMVATTLLTAAGAHLVLFTTGRGTPFGGVVPTMKISSNSALAQRKPRWIDFDAGRLLAADADSAALDDEFFDQVLACASGALARNEQEGYEEIALFKDGVTL
ncbi:MAG: altronate dehydratase [Lentisphaerae bacterium]|nr:altronate dehydratase [Lentisphaerota bacterium]